MNAWKKLLALMLALVLVLSLSACGSKSSDTSAPAAEESVVEEVEEEVEEAVEEAAEEVEEVAEEVAEEVEEAVEEVAEEVEEAVEGSDEEAAEEPAEEASEDTAAAASTGDAAEIPVENFGSGTLEVRIWDNTQLAGLKEIADLWTAKSGVQVNIQVITWDDYWTMLEAGASGGEMPDVFWMHSNNAEMYMSAGKLLDLTPYIEASEVTDMSNYLQGVTELYSKDGKYYAIPKDHDTIGLLYNEAIFEKYGVDVPTDNMTWEQYGETAKAITDAAKEAGDDGVYGIAMNTTNDQDGYFNAIYAYGGYVISEDRKSSGWDNENTKTAMEFIVNMISEAGTPQATVAENGTDTLFTSGLVGMITQGTWMIRSFMEADDSANYKWAMLPYYDANGNGECDEGERVTIYNGLGWSAAADTKMPDAAYSLIEWFGSEAMQLKQSELGVTMAAYEGCSEAFAESFAAAGTDISAFIRMENDATLVFRPYSKYTSRWSDEYQKQLVNAWQDPSKLDGILTDLASSMNNWLAQE